MLKRIVKDGLGSLRMLTMMGEAVERIIILAAFISPEEKRRN
jgi:hypothetical protein